MPRPATTALALVLAALPLVCMGDHRHGPTGTYTEWIWPDPPAGKGGKTGFLNFEHRLTPEVDPGPDVGYFWAHQVQFVEGDTAYFGLQTLGRHPDGSEGKVAIFSIWNALAARGPGLARPFDGEGEGYQTVIPFDWKANRTYRLRIFQSGGTRLGTEWTATVREDPQGRERVIGTITGPKNWHRLGNWSVMWSERYTGPDIHTCADVGYSCVRFGKPLANDRSIHPLHHRNFLAVQPNCPNSRVRDAGDGTLQEMGVPR